MKALSFRQPWAELVLQGRKTMDLRTYGTDYRGRIAIHASKTIEREAAQKLSLSPDELAVGGIIGTVELVDVIPLSEEEYAARRAEHLGGRSYCEGMAGWMLARPERLPQPIPARGRTRLFNVELEGIGDQGSGIEENFESSATSNQQPDSNHQPIKPNSTALLRISPLPFMSNHWRVGTPTTP